MVDEAIIAIQGDQLESLSIRTDTSLYWGNGMQESGYSLFWYEYNTLYILIENGIPVVYAKGYFIKTTFKFCIGTSWERVSGLIDLELNKTSCVFIRQNPPFDMNYISSVSFLELIKVPIINSPHGLKKYLEKLSPLILAYDALPPTLISSSLQDVLSFIKNYNEVVIKPLNDFAGGGVTRLSFVSPEEINLNQYSADKLNFVSDNHIVFSNLYTISKFIEKYIEDNGNMAIIAQKFFKEIFNGDMRVFVLDGEVVGCFSRKPAQDSFIVNLAKGGSASLLEFDHQSPYGTVCTRIARELKKDGIVIAGIDIIANYIIEINITSPTGFIILDELFSAKYNRDKKFTIRDRMVQMTLKYIDRGEK